MLLMIQGGLLGSHSGMKTLQECENALTSQYKSIFSLFVFLFLVFSLSIFLPFFLFVFSSFCPCVCLSFLHHSDQMFEWSHVSKVTLCVQILKWRSVSQGRG